VKNVRVAGIYTVLCFSSVRGLFLIFILSPPPHALEQKRKRKKKKKKKKTFDPMGLPTRPLFTTAGLTFSYYYNSRLECCRTL